MRRLALLLLLAIPGALAAQDSSLASRTKGQASAPVTVYEMSDFQCPFCRRFAMDVFPAIEKEYIGTGKVRWIFINYPLTSLHPNAAAAAEFAVCASKQNRFWPAHDALYEQQETWAPIKDPAPFFMSLIPKLKLNSAVMTECLRSGAGREIVRGDTEGARRSKATSTPSFYVEGGMMSGVYPIETWRKVLDSVVKAKGKK